MHSPGKLNMKHTNKQERQINHHDILKNLSQALKLFPGWCWASCPVKPILPGKPVSGRTNVFYLHYHTSKYNHVTIRVIINLFKPHTLLHG